MSGTSAALTTAREADAVAARTVKTFQANGQHAEARERFAELVARHQRRANRIAYHYLREAADADEAVQDAFVKAFSHLSTFREELPFDVWFTRILINGCLDRIKARTRRERWLLPMSGKAGGRGGAAGAPAPAASAGCCRCRARRAAAGVPRPRRPPTRPPSAMSPTAWRPAGCRPNR